MSPDRILIAVACLIVLATSVQAGDEDLAKKSQNPLADMISLPIKNKFNFDRGEEDAFAYELELQPVVPVHLGEWNLINRFIIPVAYQEPAYDGLNYEFGLKDITYQAFFSPREPGGIIWGVGPAFILTTNTANSLGNDKWAAGPAAVALAIRGPWVNGILAQHFWDFAGDDDAAVQPDLLVPRPVPRHLSRPPRTAGGLTARSLRQCADRHLAGQGRPRPGKLQSRRAAVLHGHARHGRT
jgi:hypothetical protein